MGVEAASCYRMRTCAGALDILVSRKKIEKVLAENEWTGNTFRDTLARRGFQQVPKGGNWYISFTHLSCCVLHRRVS